MRLWLGPIVRELLNLSRLWQTCPLGPPVHNAILYHVLNTVEPGRVRRVKLNRLTTPEREAVLRRNRINIYSVITCLLLGRAKSIPDFCKQPTGFIKASRMVDEHPS
jgi:hypothetical protein